MEVSRLSAPWSVAILTIVLGLSIDYCQACSRAPGPEPTLVERVHKAENMLYGWVRKTYRDPESDPFYTIEMQVFCNLKGPKTPLLVNVSGAGVYDSLCAESEFEVNKKYVVVANVHRGELYVSAGKEILANRTSLRQIRRACGLNPVTRPEGSTSSALCPVSITKCIKNPKDKNRNRTDKKETEKDLTNEVFDKDETEDDQSIQLRTWINETSIADSYINDI